MLLRSICLAVLAALSLQRSCAQAIRGQFVPAGTHPGGWVILFDTYGSEHHAIDSVKVTRAGTFEFKARPRSRGFHQLGTASDRVDLILGTGEPLLELRFEGTPLQEHISVLQSIENQRLWEYKRASREAQAHLQYIAEKRAATAPTDLEAFDRLKNEEADVQQRLRSTLDRMIDQDTASYFARVVLTDRRLMAAIEHGTLAIRNAVRWDDPGLVHSAIHEKAIMAVLQSATPASLDVLASASDSILAWARPDTTCWRFARRTLAELFTTYGPPEIVQHIVDRYILGPGAILPPEQELLRLVAEQLRMSIGSTAPDALLPSPLRSDTTSVSVLAKGHKAIVLFFYSSTCDHCHEQMPGLQALYEEYHGPLQVVGIALDDDRQSFVDNLAAMHLTFPCFTELVAWGSPAAKAYAVKATPTFFVLDASLRILGKPYDSAELRAFLKGHLGPKN